MKRLLRLVLPGRIGSRLLPGAHGAPFRAAFPELKIAHLTDLHFCTADDSRYPASAAVLARTVDDLNQQDLDAVIFTGDLFDRPHSLVAEAPRFAAVLADLRHPWYVAFGNHDVEGHGVAERKAFLKDVLGDHGLSNARESWYSVKLPGGVRLVVLDTTDNGSPDYLTWRGHISERQVAWLDETLTAARNEFTIVAMHHPPVEPYPFMDSLKFNEVDKRRLEAVLAGHPQVTAIFCGHFHISGCLPFGYAHVMAGPGLVEHPHAYRVFDVHPREHAISFDCREVRLSEEDEALAMQGSARLRSRLLTRLGHAHAGHVRLAPGPWKWSYRTVAGLES